MEEKRFRNRAGLHLPVHPWTHVEAFKQMNLSEYNQELDNFILELNL